ncbi:hypothetical protein CMV_004356 [Castanea mollissima]|uniref:Uncharacterized protein n=1 Tax=Castanea mollissima TaxID=60419 RepID=A0A8J4W4Z8_9ROSI|nr:hypothetical protein CMV_004356 [Castanea mollissima]
MRTGMQKTVELHLKCFASFGPENTMHGVLRVYQFFFSDYCMDSHSSPRLHLKKVAALEYDTLGASLRRLTTLGDSPLVHRSNQHRPKAPNPCCEEN